MNLLKEEKRVDLFVKDGWKKVGWRSPSNIALIKYWGKKGRQLPMNPSLSFSLADSYTGTSVFFRKKTESTKKIDFEYIFDGQQNTIFKGRIEKFLQSIIDEFPFLIDFEFRIESHNSFPHSAGIASSASSMSALALCLCSIEKELKSENKSQNEFLKRASFISRLGSGSASRSVYGGFSAWGQHETIKELNDHFAIPLTGNFHKIFQNLQDSILIIDREQKKISSSQGHHLMKTHPQREQRIRQANLHFSEIQDVLKTGNFHQFVSIVESEALAIHQLMKSSTPSYSLAKPNTYKVIDKIVSFRNKTKLPVCFTLDAGPNVHLIHPLEIKKEMVNFIKCELLEFCSNGFWIDDNMGEGPIML